MRIIEQSLRGNQRVRGKLAVLESNIIKSVVTESVSERAMGTYRDAMDEGKIEKNKMRLAVLESHVVNQ